MKKPSRKRGFTVIELLVTLAISALLSSLAITFSNIGRNQVALSIEAAKISQLILEAKSLSITTYAASSAACGYGVVFNTASQTYSIFGYAPAGTSSCPAVANITTIATNTEQQYSPGTWQIHVANGVTMQSATDSLAMVLFYPPNPDVLLSHSGGAFFRVPSTLNVHLVTVDGQNSAEISVNPAGQVSW